MAQYEQKTDSREFEVANPEQSPGPWRGGASEDASDIVLRLWSPERSRLNAPLTWKTDSVLVYMIADLVGASRGRIAEESSPIMSAHFDGSRQALVAAKRIQTSILEFLACRPGDHVGAAILIYRSRRNDPTGYAPETVQQMLRQAKPGQILLAASISERLRDLPGVEFRTVPAQTTVMGDRQIELTELMWTTPEQIAWLQSSIPDDPEPRIVDGPAVGATLIVDSPFARRGTRETIPPVAGAADFVFKEGSESASRHIENRAPIAEPTPDSAASSILEGLDDFEERPLITRTRVLLGLVALVLVAAVIAVLYRPTHVSKVPIPPLQEQSGATDSPDKATPVTPQPAAKTAQPESETVKPAAKLPAVARPQPQRPAKPTPEKGAKSKTETQDAAQEPEIIEESGGLSLNDIPKLLDFANADTGNGRYDKARLEYRKVLKLQPNNQEAKDGLKKLDRIQSDQQ